MSEVLGQAAVHERRDHVRRSSLIDAYPGHRTVARCTCATAAQIAISTASAPVVRVADANESVTPE